MDNETLFSLIKRRTEERKISWTWSTSSTAKITGSVPGTTLRLEITHGSDQREGDWYTLVVTVGGATTQVGNESQIESLYEYILDQPASVAEAEAREILLSL